MQELVSLCPAAFFKLLRSCKKFWFQPHSLPPIKSNGLPLKYDVLWIDLTLKNCSRNDSLRKMCNNKRQKTDFLSAILNMIIISRYYSLNIFPHRYGVIPSHDPISPLLCSGIFLNNPLGFSVLKTSENSLKFNSDIYR